MNVELASHVQSSGDRVGETLTDVNDYLAFTAEVQVPVQEEDNGPPGKILLFVTEFADHLLRLKRGKLENFGRAVYPVS